jgi:hypothetical protein
MVPRESNNLDRSLPFPSAMLTQGRALTAMIWKGEKCRKKVGTSNPPEAARCLGIQRNQPPAKPLQPFNMPSMSTAGRHCKLKTNLYRMEEKIRSMQFLTCIFEARIPTYPAS